MHDLKKSAAAVAIAVSALAANSAELPAAKTDERVGRIEEMLGGKAGAAAVKACLDAHASEKFVPMIESIWHAHLDGVGMTTVDISGKRQSCYYNVKTRSIERLHSPFDASGPLFLAAEAHPAKPEGECIVAKRVEVAGVFRGWMVAQRPPQAEPGPDACSVPVWEDIR
ncbi:hypothetical protein [Lysobacter antibioticus]|uniref:hypothetical protein n=1 Tax=Lysobacter antibioticus TaxID=84531 RepID=UPI0004CFF0FD|nr:hypothetical protein [Lysobacter antibioticus]